MDEYFQGATSHAASPHSHYAACVNDDPRAHVVAHLQEVIVVYDAQKWNLVAARQFRDAHHYFRPTRAATEREMDTFIEAPLRGVQSQRLAFNAINRCRMSAR